MARASVTQETVKRAVKAVLAAGMLVARVEVDPDGRIIVITADDPRAKTPHRNDWD